MEFRYGRRESGPPAPRAQIRLSTDRAGNGDDDAFVSVSTGDPNAFRCENSGWERHYHRETQTRV